jgi:hypothetical protein
MQINFQMEQCCRNYLLAVFYSLEMLMLTFFVNHSPTFHYMEILITINRANSKYRLVCHHFMHHFLVKTRTANQLIDEPPFCINLYFCFTLRSNLSLRCSLQHYYRRSVTAQVVSFALFYTIHLL